MTEYLAYGTVGLGLALAVLTVGLLIAEGKNKPPRNSMLAAIYVFMAFSLVLVGLGLFSEYRKSGEVNSELLADLRKRVQPELEKAKDHADGAYRAGDRQNCNANAGFARDNIKEAIALLNR